MIMIDFVSSLIVWLKIQSKLFSLVDLVITRVFNKESNNTVEQVGRIFSMMDEFLIHDCH